MLGRRFVPLTVACRRCCSSERSSKGGTLGPAWHRQQISATAVPVLLFAAVMTYRHRTTMAAVKERRETKKMVKDEAETAVIERNRSVEQWQSMVESRLISLEHDHEGGDGAVDSEDRGKAAATVLSPPAVAATAAAVPAPASEPLAESKVPEQRRQSDKLE